MGFRRRVALVVITVFIIEVDHTRCLTLQKSQNEKVLSKKAELFLKDCKIESVNKAAVNKINHNESIKRRPYRKLKSFCNQAPPLYLSDVGNFPEVQYPMAASETWVPNYWDYLPFTNQNKFYKNDAKFMRRKKVNVNNVVPCRLCPPTTTTNNVNTKTKNTHIENCKLNHKKRKTGNSIGKKIKQGTSTPCKGKNKQQSKNINKKNVQEKSVTQCIKTVELVKETNNKTVNVAQSNDTKNISIIAKKDKLRELASHFSSIISKLEQLSILDQKSSDQIKSNSGSISSEKINVKSEDDTFLPFSLSDYYIRSQLLGLLSDPKLSISTLRTGIFKILDEIDSDSKEIIEEGCNENKNQSNPDLSNYIETIETELCPSISVSDCSIETNTEKSDVESQKDKTFIPVQNIIVCNNKVELATDNLITSDLAEDLRDAISNETSTSSLIEDLTKIISMLTVWGSSVDFGDISSRTTQNYLCEPTVCNLSDNSNITCDKIDVSNCIDNEDTQNLSFNSFEESFDRNNSEIENITTDCKDFLKSDINDVFSCSDDTRNDASDLLLFNQSNEAYSREDLTMMEDTNKFCANTEVDCYSNEVESMSINSNKDEENINLKSNNFNPIKYHHTGIISDIENSSDQLQNSYETEVDDLVEKDRTDMSNTYKNLLDETPFNEDLPIETEKTKNFEELPTNQDRNLNTVEILDSVENIFAQNCAANDQTNIESECPTLVDSSVFNNTEIIQPDNIDEDNIDFYDFQDQIIYLGNKSSSEIDDDEIPDFGDYNIERDDDSRKKPSESISIESETTDSPYDDQYELDDKKEYFEALSNSEYNYGAQDDSIEEDSEINSFTASPDDFDTTSSGYGDFYM